jgi:hypothetical protein
MRPLRPVGLAGATPAATRGARIGLWRAKPPQTGVATAVPRPLPDPASPTHLLISTDLSQPRINGGPTKGPTSKSCLGFRGILHLASRSVCVSLKIICGVQGPLAKRKGVAGLVDMWSTRSVVQAEVVPPRRIGGSTEAACPQGGPFLVSSFRPNVPTSDSSAF